MAAAAGAGGTAAGMSDPSLSDAEADHGSLTIDHLVRSFKSRHPSHVLMLRSYEDFKVSTEAPGAASRLQLRTVAALHRIEHTPNTMDIHKHAFLRYAPRRICCVSQETAVATRSSGGATPIEGNIQARVLCGY